MGAAIGGGSDGWGAGLVRTFVDFFKRSLPLLAAVLLFAIWTGDLNRIYRQTGEPLVFLSETNLRNIVNQQAIIGVCAVGAALVIFSGGIDLAVGSTVALASVAATLAFDGVLSSSFADKFLPARIPPVAAFVFTLVVLLLVHRFADGRMHAGKTIVWIGVWVLACIAMVGKGGYSAVAAGVSVGLACGYINGLLVAASRVAPFIITLGTMEIFRGATEQWSGQTKVNLLDRAGLADYPWLKNLTLAIPEWNWMLVATSVWVFAGAAVAAGVLLWGTKLGRYVYAVGSNEEACRLSGTPVVAVKIWVYSLAGLLAGVAGVLQFARLKSGDPSAGRGYELEAIAAVVIGGGSLRGGEGSLQGVVFGVLLMGVLRNGCNLANIPNSMERILIGTIIVAAVALDERRRRGLGR